MRAINADSVGEGHYSLFDLRDGNSADPGIFCNFGVLRDDCTPRPAFATYQRLIVELGAE